MKAVLGALDAPTAQTLLDMSVLSDTKRKVQVFMTCYHPLFAEYKGMDKDGKCILRFLSSKKYDFHIDSQKRLIAKSKLTDSMTIYERKCKKGDKEHGYMMIPCGQCIGCRIKYSKEWACRMILESQYHDCCSFITLTYNDENLPLSSYVDKNGELKTSMTLDKKAPQLFMKRLRKYLEPKKIRYFLCGEYGEKYHRPHYHAIIFGEDFSEDRELLKLCNGNAYYSSPILQKLWPYGYNLVCDVSYETCAYVARYVTKKAESMHKSWCEYYNCLPEFNLMSRKPGIGRLYYDDHKEEIYERFEIFVSGLTGGKKLKPPRYYNELYDLEEPVKMQSIREEIMEMSDNISDEKLKRTGLSLLEMLEVEERNFRDKIKSLRRDKIDGAETL